MYYDSSNHTNSEPETSAEAEQNTSKSSDQISSLGKKELTQSPNNSLTNPGQEAQDRSHTHKRHKHISPAYHSEPSQRKFFALAADLGYNANEVKERGAAHFKHDCFNELTQEEINDLISKMKATAYAKGLNVDDY